MGRMNMDNVTEKEMENFSDYEKFKAMPKQERVDLAERALFELIEKHGEKFDDILDILFNLKEMGDLEGEKIIAFNLYAIAQQLASMLRSCTNIEPGEDASRIIENTLTFFRKSVFRVQEKK